MNLIDGIFDYTLNGLDKTMDYAFRRNEALVSNVANAETPQYRAVDYDFSKSLKAAFRSQTGELQNTNSKHLDFSSKLSPKLTADLSGATKADGNNVDIDQQMVKLMQNSGKYTSAAHIARDGP